MQKNTAMRTFVKKHILGIIFSVAGATAGFLYWNFIGCLSGTCVIKSTWYLSTLYGLVFGYVLGSLAEDLVAKFRKEKKA